MAEANIRNIEVNDFEIITRINELVVESMSPMDTDRLKELLGFCEYSKAAIIENEIAGFILAMKEGSKYPNKNYEWFSRRYERFLYIDRIAINPSQERKGIGTLLYNNLFEYSKSKGFEYVVCEINVIPPNDQSLKFHRKFGFSEVGQQELANGKRVSMQLCYLGNSKK
jgi:predicted GNAT superfamily acetyltransferase